MRRRNAIPRNQREVLAKERALATVAGMRREKLSLSKAAKAEGTHPNTVRRYAGSALLRRPGGLFRVTRQDKIARTLNFMTPQGEIPIVVRSSRTASRIAEHLNAIRKYRNTGDSSALIRFRGKVIRTTAGQAHQFVTDTQVLDKLGNAGVLAVEGLYRAVSGSGD